MIDWTRVHELVDEIGAEDFAEVVELFLDEVETAIDLLDTAEGNPIVTQEQMHFLKGAALNLGFESLAQLCIKGERAAAAGQPEAVPPSEVRQVYGASREVFEQDLPNQIAA